MIATELTIRCEVCRTRVGQTFDAANPTAEKLAADQETQLLSLLIRPAFMNQPEAKLLVCQQCYANHPDWQAADDEVAAE